MTCPLCQQENGPLVRYFHPSGDQNILDHLQIVHSDWNPDSGACTRCVDQAQLYDLVRRGKLSAPSTLPDGSRILPIPDRLEANTGYTGRGVTICFVDAGFYPHPDLTHPHNRILHVYNVHDPSRPETVYESQAQSWHGTMTTVVGAGNGSLSGGYYRSLAPEANVVLLKVMDERDRIDDGAILRALEWIRCNHASYGIRVVNLSVAGEAEAWESNHPLNQAINHLSELGVSIVAAAGNDDHAALLLPAGSPLALTVGGLDDHNTLPPDDDSLYHSTYGKTADQRPKPELIAPAIWVPAPILPGTDEQRAAAALWKIQNAETPRYRSAVAANVGRLTHLPQPVQNLTPQELSNHTAAALNEAKFLSAHYQHADGTSFAAPIVCGLIAQILEARPDFSPADIREVILKTARPLPGIGSERQGFGVLCPSRALKLALGADAR